VNAKLATIPFGAVPTGSMVKAFPAADFERMSTDNSSGSSPSPRILRPKRAAPADAVRPTRAEVNLGHLRHNLHALKKQTDAGIYAVLKADAYGHGAPAVARTLERAQVDGFAVALLEEAVELRNAGITRPILVMGGYYGSAWDEVLASQVTPVVYDAAQVEGLAAAVRYAGTAPVLAHVKIDTGMARLGVKPNELTRILDAFHRFPEVKLDGLMTHFACADDRASSGVQDQLRIFEAASQAVRDQGFAPRIRHAANSAALLLGTAPGLDYVRPGLALYGVAPTSGVGEDLRPVMRVRSEIVALRSLEVGESAGYGWSWTASRPSILATIPIGYADGLPRALSNKGHFLVRGQRAPIVGAVSMDMVMLDVTDIEGATHRDEVIVLGSQEGPHGKLSVTTEDIAGWAGTISWEILTNVSRRVPRFYREP
jgi:alanine racemase